MKRILSTLIFAVLAVAASAQSIRDVKINEVLVINSDSYVDGYGHRSPWIELHNTSHGRIRINGCYLRVYKADGSEVSYRIPNDPGAELGPLGYALFFCDGSSTRGTFYTNFTLEGVERIELLNANGREVIDSMPIDRGSLLPDVSVGRAVGDDGGVSVETLPQTTPMATNDTEDALPKHEKFRRLDPYGAYMAMIAVSVVFSALLVLFVFFKLFGKYMVRLARRKQKLAAAEQVRATGVEKSADIAGNSEEIAAIALAIQLYLEDIHDHESDVITINRVARTYSPWSSKIYGVSQTLKRK